MGSYGLTSWRAKDPIAMPFSVPKPMPPAPDVKEALPDKGRCLVCFETDPAKYANCDRGDCYPIVADEYKAPTGFSRPQPLVSAFELAARMRRKALSLDWDQDELRDKLMLRARQLEKGDSAEVPNEDF